MSVTNYTRGRAFEYRVRDVLSEAGYHVVRAAGSKGAVDLVACKPGVVLAVQCKRDGSLPGTERVRLQLAASAMGARPVLAWQQRGGLKLDWLTPEGHRPLQDV